MQSASEPNESLKLGYYLWLAAIGAIVYAYVFATSRAEMANTSLDPLDPNENITEDDKKQNRTRHSLPNTGHRVITLLPLVWLYAVLTKVYNSFAVEHADNLRFTIGNFILTLLTLVGLVFVSIGATQSNDPGAKMNITGSERTGWFTTNIVLLGIIAVFPLWSMWGGRANFLNNLSAFVFSFWFPFMMMVYLVKTGATDWFRIVAVVSIVAAIAYNLYNLYNIYIKNGLMTPGLESLKESVKYFFNTSPLLSYLKFVETNDLIDVVAKRVLIFALLCYVAYLMISVYKFKNSLVPCVSTHFASCFWDPEFKQTGYDPNKNTPYINALFYTLMMTMGVNILNYLIVLFGPWLMNTQLMINIKNLFNNTTNTAAPVPPYPGPWESLKTLFQLIFFPFVWIVKLFVQHPIITIVAFIAFAALGVLLYRSSFDLTAFIEGQRGTVITLFTLFIASLILFGVYTYTGTSSGTSRGTSSGTSRGGTTNSNSSGPTYSEFILRPMMFIAVAACIIGIISYFVTSQSRLVTMANLLQYGITMLIYITGIAIVIGIVRTVFSMSRKMGDSMFQTSEDSNWVINVLKLIGNVLFYLPCLMLDFVDVLKEQYGLTSRPYWILLAVEAAFILAGLYLPSLVTKAINHTGVQIVSAPISMTVSTKITRYTVQFVDSKGVVSHASGPNPLPPLPSATPTSTPTPTPTMNPTDIKLQNYSYGVSAWFYIRPQPPNTQSNSNEQLNVFNFQDPGIAKEMNIGPNVSYNPKTNELQVTIGESAAIPPITDIPLQRWNNIVINSDKGAIDIFMNGKLVYTGTHLPRIPNARRSSPVNNVVIGNGKAGDENKDDDAKDKTFGIQGELCNMVLKHEPFTNAEIAWFYKTNKMLNPPLVGVNPDPLNQGDSASYLASQSVSNKIADNEHNVDKTPNNPLSFSTSGATRYGFLGAFFGAILGWLFNRDDEAVKGLLMGTVVFGIIGALLGALFSTDGTVANIMKTVANVFVNTF